MEINYPSISWQFNITVISINGNFEIPWKHKWKTAFTLEILLSTKGVNKFHTFKDLTKYTWKVESNNRGSYSSIALFWRHLSSVHFNAVLGSVFLFVFT